jgi:hypothetical protein
MNIGRLPGALYNSFPFPHLSPLYGAPGPFLAGTSYYEYSFFGDTSSYYYLLLPYY